ncbi:hypothetical protein CsSME_00013313 [Camellia sinensis var. sinensis]
MSTKSFRKYHSMELQASPPPPYQSPTALRVFKKSYSFEFPTSPQPPIIRPEDQILHHPSHQQHPLVRLTTTLPNLFTCSGCKDYGAGKRFACQQCDFQLHEFCALSPPSLDNHPLHPQHLLLFNPKSKQVLFQGQNVIFVTSRPKALHSAAVPLPVVSRCILAVQCFLLK